MSGNRENESKYQFLLRNIFRGLLVLGLFIAAFVLFKKYVGVDYQLWFQQLNVGLVFTVYALSELFFGIITPEIFMAWGLEQGDYVTYIKIIIALMLISYSAGYINYRTGRHFRQLSIVRWFIQKRMGKYRIYLNKFGGFLLIVASTTPLPYAAICLLVGTLHFPQQKFLLFTLTRLLRFTVYGFIVWQANAL